VGKVRPFARITRESVEEANLRKMQEHVSRLPNRLAFERWLLGFTNPAPGMTIEDTRLQIRRMLQPSGRFTVEALRAQRLEREARERLNRERALRVAARQVAD
jgi:hypothetical protein